MRHFTVGELWGPLAPCRCGAESDCIILTDAENASLPEPSGPEAVTFIFKNELGIDSCWKCIPQIEKELEKKSKNG